MGYVFITATCFSCKKLINFNPNKVPSIRIEGVREPICRECIELANPRRIENGLEPVVVQEGAYDACDESEIY